jgi:WD40 repeat protein
LSDSIPSSTLDKFTTFGDLLRYLRRRAGITQLELSIAVGYSDPHISRLEQNLRLPDIPTIQARFISPLCLEDEPRAVARLIELASAIRREDAPTPGLCPYKGMDFFDEVDTDLYVGRETLTERLISIVLATASKSETNKTGFIAIVGASGSGKSSLVRAGLVPALRWNKASANWSIHIFTPSVHPLENLATKLAQNKSLTSIVELMDDLARDPRTLSLFINREIKSSPGSYLLLVIDQFEELFTLCHSDAERSAFINNLLTTAFDSDVKAIIVITLRADFYAHCANYPQLRLALAKHQEYIGAMSDDEMRRAIEEPARRGHWEIERGLVDLILRDVGHEPGALPLLSHALFETWQRRRGRLMTFSGYASSGGVRGAIAETAESVFTDQFTREQQAIARRIFLRLTELGDETASGDTRRRATMDELILKPEESDATEAVINVLVDSRLITTSENSIQVAHEALIREWPTLRGWLEDNREGLRLHRQLTEASQDWQSLGGEPDMLYRGARLAQVKEWAISHADEMNSLEKQYLEASIASGEREVAEREAARHRELETAQKLAESERQRAEEQLKTSRRLKRRAIVASVFGIIALILVGFAIFAWQRAADQAALNQSLRLVSAAQRANESGNGDLALALGMDAVKSDRPPQEAILALRDVALNTGTRAILQGHSSSVRAVDISPDGKTAFSGSCSRLSSDGSCIAGELILWDLLAMKELKRWSAHSDWVSKVVFSSDKQYLISSAQDGSVFSWSMSGEKIRSLTGLAGKITDLVTMPNKTSVLISLDDGSLIQWDFLSGNLLLFARSRRGITALAIATKALLVVTAHSDGSLTLWDIYTRQPIRSYSPKGSGINQVAITPDGNRIFFSGTDTIEWSIHMMDAFDGTLLKEQPLGELPSDLALSHDGVYLIASYTVGIKLINLQNWDKQYDFRELTGFANAVALSQLGNLGIIAGADGTLRVWNLGYQESFETNDLGADSLSAITINPDGKYLLISDSADVGCCQPALWDIEQRRIDQVYSLPISNVAPGAIKISPDGHHAAAAGIYQGAPTILLWNLENGKLLCKPFDSYTVPPGKTINGRSVAFSPDSLYLLAGSQEFNGNFGELFLWNVQSCGLVRRFNNTKDVSSIAFNSDGSRVISGSGLEGKVNLWDVATGEAIGHYTWADYGAVLGVAFGPGDKTILGSGLSDIYLWDADTKDIIRGYTGLTMSPYTVALSSDGKYVLSGTMNGEVVLWDFSNGHEVNRINTHLSVYSVGFSPDGKIAFAGTDQGILVEWHFSDKPLSELLEWIKANRYVRELTEAEKIQYRIEP